MKTKKRIFNKIPGIYIVENIATGRKYVGHSINVGMRWYTHLDSLAYGKHVSKLMQDDYDEYGAESFSFRIIETVEKCGDLKERLVKLEQEYMDSDEWEYNTFRASKKYANSIPAPERFIEFINDRWLLPKDATDKEKRKYMIYKKEDKLEIIDMAHRCSLFNLVRSRLTFIMVVRLMKETLGYTIESSRKSINNKQFTYKLVMNYDARKVTYKPPKEKNFFRKEKSQE